ncbi:hypothetical protein FQZ97_1100680 [compost metagenome]
MHNVALQLAEYEVQHVVEVHTNIGGHAEGFTRIAFPALHVPLAARGDVGEFYIVFVLAGFTGNLILEVKDCLVVPQLQDVVNAFAGFPLDQYQLIEYRRSWYQRFLTDHVAA